MSGERQAIISAGKGLAVKEAFLQKRKVAHQKLRHEYVTQEHIANLAYKLWEREDYPNGDEWIKTPLGWMIRRDYHWCRAELMLEMFADQDAEVLCKQKRS